MLFSMLSCRQSYQIHHKNLCAANVKKNVYNNSGKNWLLSKKLVFCFCPLKLVFGTQGSSQTKNVDRPMFKRHPMYPKPAPSAIQNIFTNMLNTMGNSLSWDSKLINSNPFKQKKRGKIVSLFGVKGSLTHKKFPYAVFFSQDPDSYVSWLCPRTKHRTSTFSNHCAKICSKL